MSTVKHLAIKSVQLLVPLTVMGAFAAAALGLPGPATAAPTGPSVEETIQGLESGGYDVIVNRAGAAPLAACTVRSVRQGQIHETVYVDIAC